MKICLSNKDNEEESLAIEGSPLKAYLKEERLMDFPVFGKEPDIILVSPSTQSPYKVEISLSPVEAYVLAYELKQRLKEFRKKYYNPKAGKQPKETP